MDIKTIVIEVERLARWAAGAVEANQAHMAKRYLVELRDLLVKELNGKPSAPG